MSLPPNPTDLDRLVVAWNTFRNLWNVNLPKWRDRAAAVRSKVSQLRP